MGATLPAMQRALLQRRGGTVPLGSLYAANTFGAVAGVLGAAFVLVPTLGLVRTTIACSLLNGLCALAALGLFAAGPPGEAGAAGAPAAVAAASGARALQRRGLLVRLAATGLLGIGYEVVVVRVLSQVAENTVYTFALLLAVYLVGSALGAAAYQRWWAAQGPHDAACDVVQCRLVCALAFACLAGSASLWGAEGLEAAALAICGVGMPAALAAEALLAVTAFLLPTFVMGALFSHLAIRALHSGIVFGQTLGANTLGAAVAPLLFGVLGVPLLGAKGALLAVAGGYLLLLARADWRRSAAGACAVAALALLVAAPPLVFIDVPEGGRLVSYQEGAMAAVSVVEDAAGVARLRIDNRQQEGSSATLLADSRQALLPLLLHPAPHRALFLGVGTGTTASAAALEPGLQVDAVDLLPEVIEASRYFTHARTGDAAPNPRLHMRVADARRFVRATPQQYDLIVADNFHPARSGSGALYTVEHFRAVSACLAEGGLFVQWLPLHQLDLATLRSIVRSFVEVYPGGWALLATNSLETPVVGLVARADATRFDLATVRARLAASMLPRPPAAFALGDDFALLGSFMAGPSSLAAFAAQAPLNTDDHPVVTYLAPRITYAPDSLPRARLSALLHELRIAPDELLSAPGGWSPRLAAYWAARNRFIDAGRDVEPSGDVRRMLAQVQAPLLSVLALSPDFRPAYDPLLAMSAAPGPQRPSRRTRNAVAAHARTARAAGSGTGAGEIAGLVSAVAMTIQRAARPSAARPPPCAVRLDSTRSRASGGSDSRQAENMAELVTGVDQMDSVRSVGARQGHRAEAFFSRVRNFLPR
jgi:spermidine synthase